VVGTHEKGGYPLVLYPFDGGKPRRLASLNKAPGDNLPSRPMAGGWFNRV